MGVLDVIRRVLLRQHRVEHDEVDERIAEADQQLGEMEVRVRRLEIEKRLRQRRGDG